MPGRAFPPGLPANRVYSPTTQRQCTAKISYGHQNRSPCWSQEIGKSGFRSRARFGEREANAPSVFTRSSIFRSKCGFEGSYPSHPHCHPLQFNTMPARNLNLVILKNEIAVTRSELVEYKCSRGNCRLHEPPSLAQRNALVHSGRGAAVPTCAQTPGALLPAHRLDLGTVSPPAVPDQASRPSAEDEPVAPF